MSRDFGFEPWSPGEFKISTPQHVNLVGIKTASNRDDVVHCIKMGTESRIRIRPES